MSVVLRQDSNTNSVLSSISMMEQISFIPSEMLNLIPRFGGEKRELNLFLRQCEYVFNKYKGDEAQNTYVMHAITSRLQGNAAALISERDDIENWEQLKEILTQYFGDHRTEELIFMELENLKIEPHETYVDFYNRVKSVRNTLLSKVNKIDDPAMKQCKTIMVNENSLNVFLYNLPVELVRTVRLSKPCSLEDALGVVTAEVNFFERYAAKNHLNSNELKKWIRPLPNFRFGIPNQNVPGFSHQPAAYSHSTGGQLFGQPQVMQQNVNNHMNQLFGSKTQAIGSGGLFSTASTSGASGTFGSTNAFGAKAQETKSLTFGNPSSGGGFTFGMSNQPADTKKDGTSTLKGIEFNKDTKINF